MASFFCTILIIFISNFKVIWYLQLLGNRESSGKPQNVLIMKRLSTLLIGLLLVGTTSFGQSAKQDRKKKKEERAALEYNQLKDLIESGDFQFMADWAMPLTGGQILMNDTPNHVFFEEGKLDIYLPFYGVIRLTTNYNSDPGIKYSGEPVGYVVSYDDDEKQAKIDFEVVTDTDRHQFNLAITHEKKAELRVISQRRDPMNYVGRIDKYEPPLNN